MRWPELSVVTDVQSPVGGGPGTGSGQLERV